MTNAESLLPLVTHDQARNSLRKFINHFFRTVGDKPTASIPAQPDSDDDLLLTRYIEEQSRRPSPAPAPEVGKLVERLIVAADQLEKNHLMRVVPSVIREAITVLSALPSSPSGEDQK